MQNSDDKWAASWIWYPGAQRIVNFHFFARKEFVIKGRAVSKALLRISAYTDYKLFIGDKFIGRGPTPCDPWYQSYDTYDVKKYLKKGKNVIGVICHNYGIGVHWQNRGPGGLIVECCIETNKEKMLIVSDRTWRVRKGTCWSLNTPRMFWSCGFMETFDFRKYENSWLNEDFNPEDWHAPEVLGPHPTKPWIRLVPREIPFLREKFEKPASMEKGNFSIQGIHAIRFDGIIPSGENHIAYAQTYFYSEKERNLILHLECDDAFKTFLNNKLVLEQNYSEEFARTRVWRGQDEYEQVHYGLGALSNIRTKIALKKGWNKILIAVDQGPGGWGFILVFLEPETKKIVELDFSADKKENKSWMLAGPFGSTGMNNSLDCVAKNIISLKTAKNIHYDPFNYDGITDYATLMKYEKRNNVKKVLLSGSFKISKGEFRIIDLGRVKTGYPVLNILSSEDAILDIGYNQVLSEARCIRFSEATKYVDRIYLKKGRQKWESFQRRTGRYIHISCRKGQNIEISNSGINSTGYPVKEIAEFESSDKKLDKIWQVSRYTTQLLMQYGYQDCLKREEGTLNTNSFNYMSRSAGCCFGDYKLARKTLKLAIQTQHDSGWFDSHGISSPNNDEITQCLYWIVWLKDYFFYSGDKAFVKEVYENMQDNLRYFSKMINQHGLIEGKNYHIVRRGQFVYMIDETSSGRYINNFQGELLGFNILYYAALSSAAILSEEIGLKERVLFYQKKARRVKESCSNRFWDEKKGLWADWRKGNTIASSHHMVFQIASVYFNLCDEEQTKKILHYLCHEIGLPDENKGYPLYNFGFYYYFLEVLFQHGYEDMALELMRKYYGRWLEAGATTFGERYHPSNLKGQRMLSSEYEVHGYGTSAHLHFYSNILGIKPLEPGFKKVLFEPRPGDLKWAKGRIYTPQGEISIFWEVKNTFFKMEIEMPKKCEYALNLPKKYKDCHVKINTKLLNLSGKKIDKKLTFDS